MNNLVFLFSLVDEKDKAIIEIYGWGVMHKVQIIREGIKFGYFTNIGGK